MVNLYIDIDGVLLDKQGKPREDLTDFLEQITKKFDCYWLTTHCKGDVSSVERYLLPKLTEREMELIKLIKPTNWNTWKTEAIDFTKDFRWLDDNLFEAERRVLASHNCEDKFVRININL